MKTALLLVLCLSIIIPALNEKVRYDNYKVYRLVLHIPQELRILKQLSNNPVGVKFWSGNRTNVVERPLDLMVPSEKIEEFEKMVKFFEFENTLIIENVQTLIDETTPKESEYCTADNLDKCKSKAFDWNDYHNLDTIHTWLESLPKEYSKVTVISGGTSAEKRDIKGVKITYGEGRKAIILEGGVHAQEWTSVSTTTYLLNEIITNRNTKFRQLVESFDWYIFPVINPDGYEYTFTTDRLWSKNRKISGDRCYGTDLNRNWDSNWLGNGASEDPCSDNYAGSSAFSEPETKSLSSFYQSISNNLIAHISFHSYKQSLLIPYGHGSNKTDNHHDLLDIARMAVDALFDRYGTRYTINTVVRELYEASGNSMDWIRETFDVPITYAYELRDTGKHGFLTPADQIIPIATEVLDSLEVILEEVKLRYL